MTGPLTANDVLQLISLKALLDRATSTVRTASAIDQSIAVVLLDAAVERATYLVAERVGDPIGLSCLIEVEAF